MKILTLLAAVVFLAGCQANSKESDKKESGEKSVSTLQVQVVQPLEQQPTYDLKLPGELHPYESLDVYAKVKGFVKRINVDVGDEVRTGQVLAVLEAPEMDIQSTADQAKSQQLDANYVVSKRRYNRLQQVQDKNVGAVSELELEQAYGAMLRDSAALQESRYSHKKTNQLKEYLLIRAPFSGIITARNFAVGALIGDTGLPFFRLVENKRLKLKVTVPELHAQSVSDNTIAAFTVLSKPGANYEAKLKRNAKVIDPVTRALALEFDVPNTKEELNGGDYTDVQLKLKREHPTLFVPTSSIIQSQSGIFVLRVIDGKEIERVPVKLGQQTAELTEVFGQIQPQDQIVKKASEEINNGQIIQIVK